MVMTKEVRTRLIDFLEKRPGTYSSKDVQGTNFAFEVSHGDKVVVALKPEEKNVVSIQVGTNINPEHRKEIRTKFSEAEKYGKYRRNLARELMSPGLSFEFNEGDGEILGFQVSRHLWVDEELPTDQELEDAIQNVVNSTLKAVFYVQDLVTDSTDEDLGMPSGPGMMHR